MKIKFNYEDIMIVVKDEVVILSSTITGQWLYVSKECYDILLYAEKSKLNDDELMSELYDEEDREYFMNLIYALRRKCILYDENLKLSQCCDLVTISITHRCNLSCIHCCVDASSINDDEYMNTKELKSIIDKILESKPNAISISGGEPLLRVDFYEIMDYLKKRFNGKLALLTNGLLINNQNVTFLAETFDSISISLDGVDEETCKMIRRSNIFEPTIEKIQMLKDIGFKNLSLSMVINSFTVDKSNEFKELCRRLDVEPLLRILAPIGRAAENADVLTTFKSMRDKQDRKESNNKDDKITYGFAFRCDAVRGKYYVESNGDIYPCQSLTFEEFKLGNVKEIDSLYDFFIKKEYKKTAGYDNFMNILPKNSSTCSKCEHNMFCVQCLVYPYAFSKIGKFEEYCQYRKKEVLRLAVASVNNGEKRERA